MIYALNQCMITACGYYIITIHDGEISIIELLKQTGFASSNSDARRLIEGAGIKLDGVKINDTSLVVKHEAVLSRGRNRFVKVCFD